MLGSKSYATLSPKYSLSGSTKKITKNCLFKDFNFFLKDNFFSTCKLLIRSIWTSDEKVKDNLVLGQSKHLLEKITYKIHFLIHFFTIFL